MGTTITRGQLKALIREAIIDSGKNIRRLNEGASDMALCDAWNECTELLGAEKMLGELFHILSEDEIRESLDQINRLYDLGLSYFDNLD